MEDAVTITLTDILDEPRASAVLYELLAERGKQESITHSTMPSPKEHEEFMRYHPYRIWYLISSDPGLYVGALNLTKHNEIGIAILKRYQRQGYARAAIEYVIANLTPFPPVPGLRGARWLANISPQNEASVLMFQKLGFSLIQHTYRKD